MEEERDEEMSTYKHGQSWVPIEGRSIEGRSGQVPGDCIPHLT